MWLPCRYDPHHDYFSFAAADENGGNRMATVLMYLASPEEGGETVFPKIPAPANQTRETGWSECAMKARHG
jgi:prolyl 4-hydroxylase